MPRLSAELLSDFDRRNPPLDKSPSRKVELSPLHKEPLSPYILEKLERLDGEAEGEGICSNPRSLQADLAEVGWFVSQTLCQALQDTLPGGSGGRGVQVGEELPLCAGAEQRKEQLPDEDAAGCGEVGGPSAGTLGVPTTVAERLRVAGGGVFNVPCAGREREGVVSEEREEKKEEKGDYRPTEWERALGIDEYSEVDGG